MPTDPKHNTSFDSEDEEYDLEEKRTLLALACEHDRVDILQQLLESSSSSSSSHINNNNSAVNGGENPQEEEEEEEEEEGDLLSPQRDRSNSKDVSDLETDRNLIFIPPLHVAIAHGSVRAANYLLRAGADPSMKVDSSDLGTRYVKYNDITAYELTMKINIPPSKREGLLHAFHAEALRVMALDDSARLELLLNSGLPVDTVVGEMKLIDWTLELCSAKKDGECFNLLLGWGAVARADTEEKKEEEEEVAQLDTEGDVVAKEGEKANTPPADPLPRTATTETSNSNEDSLINNALEKGLPKVHKGATLKIQVEESEALASSLSTVLDGLAEEVSMCNQLLLGGGSTALVQYVRTIKASMAQKEIELEHYKRRWCDEADEYLYLQRCFPQLVKKEDTLPLVSINSEEASGRKEGENNSSDDFRGDIELADDSVEVSTALLAASQEKVRKLKASIGDLTEENSRNLLEIERRGLSGVIVHARKLAEELQSLNYDLKEVKKGEGQCRAQIIRFKLLVSQHQKEQKRRTEEIERASNQNNSIIGETGSETSDSTPVISNGPRVKSSEIINEGLSTAMVQYSDTKMFDFWGLILRILGIGTKAMKDVVRIRRVVSAKEREPQTI